MFAVDTWPIKCSQISFSAVPTVAAVVKNIFAVLMYELINLIIKNRNIGAQIEKHIMAITHKTWNNLNRIVRVF